MQTEQTSHDLLIDEENYVRVSAGKRFGNYLIDLIIFYFLVMLLLFLLAFVNPNLFESFTQENSGTEFLLNIVGLIVYALYMGVVEAVFKGKSIGKLLTKCRAVNLDGSKISTSKAFARGFSRAVPFCAFSAFGTPSDPWQDRWTNTMVVKD
jgi:uncharacterized RDD family membrane protein YckC